MKEDVITAHDDENWKRRRSDYFAIVVMFRQVLPRLTSLHPRCPAASSTLEAVVLCSAETGAIGSSAESQDARRAAREVDMMSECAQFNSSVFTLVSGLRLSFDF